MGPVTTMRIVSYLARGSVAAKFESMARFEFSCHVILNLCSFDITWSVNPLILNL